MATTKTLCFKSAQRPQPVGSAKRRGSDPKKIHSGPQHTARKAPVARGTHVLHQIEFLQGTAHLLIPRMSFSRLVGQYAKEAADNLNVKEFRWQSKALLALQHASEMYMTGFFEDANLCAIHRGRVTLDPRDTDLVKRLRGMTNEPRTS